jgi:UDP-2,3-diacylglucosamine pyrophosphatase LpxH
MPVRSIWISDVHPGTRGCQADFLRRHEAEYLYLAGDIGHIHSADILPMEGELYCNDGDWVESCTALIELTSGELQIVDWAASRRSMPVRAAA